MGGKGKKLYAYVDESGQDTAGRMFIVAVVVTDERREELRQALEAVETASKKEIRKWTHTPRTRRTAYIEGVCRLVQLRRNIFSLVDTSTRSYDLATATATARAILHLGYAERTVSVFVDGLPKSHAPSFTATLRKYGIHTHKVRGVRRDENEPLIRLADAICGLQRDALNGQVWARALLLTMQHALSLP